MNILNIFRRDDSIERERDAIKSELAETVKEREGLKRDLVAERLKFKNAARDLAALVEENEALRTDAEKLRSKRANDAALKREKRAAAKAQPIKRAA